LRSRNSAFAAVVAGAAAMLVVVTRLPLPAHLFGFEPPPLAPWLLAAVLPLVMAALLKAGRHRRATATMPEHHRGG
jgi:hypothetical protein